MQMQKTRSDKGLQTKNALKAMRTERKQVENFSNKNSIKDLTTKKHPMSTRKCREESKKIQGEREILKLFRKTKQQERAISHL
jgi:hypothetical protein